MSLQTTTWPGEYQSYGVTLKPIGIADLEMVRQWRNAPFIASLMLDRTEITSQMQQLWFSGLMGDQSRAYWVAYFKQLPIGVASLTNIDLVNKTAEPGMYIYPEQYRNNIVPFCVAFALNDFAFDVLKLTTLYGKIYPDNHASVRFHQKCGYRCYQHTDELDLYQLTADHYMTAKAPIAHFIRY